MRQGKVGRNLFTFGTEDFIHFGWELMAKSYERVRIYVSDFISQSSHHCIDVNWSRISINSLRVYRSHAFDIPEIIPFGSKKQVMLTLAPPKSWSVLSEMLFHELLI